jgi:hypothetical protein
MDKQSKSSSEPSQSGFDFPALDEAGINAYFPDPITGMNDVLPSDSTGTRRCNSTIHSDMAIESQLWSGHRSPGFPSKGVRPQDSESVTRAVPAQSEPNVYLKPTASQALSDPHARNDTKQNQLLLLTAINGLLNPAICSLPVDSPNNGRRPQHGCAPAIFEPRRMPSAAPYLSPAHRISSSARPPPYVDPRRIPTDIAAIIAAAAASMAGPFAAPSRASNPPPPPSAAAAAAYAAMPPPPPRAPLAACARCCQHGCGCHRDGARRRRWPGAMEPLSLGPGDPDSCRPTARRRVNGGGAGAAGAAGAAMPL